MAPSRFKLGMAQMLVEPGEVDRNLRRATTMIQQAAQAKCDIMVLPECLDVGWTHPDSRQLAQPIPGEYSQQLSEAARTWGLYVVAGLTEREGDRLFNAAVLIAPDGRLLLKHRKINILEIAQDLYATGNCLCVAETSAGTIGIPICADNFPNSLALGHALARMGAQMLLSPSAWAVAADHNNKRDPYGELWRQSFTTLARLYDITVVGVSNVGWITAGPWQGRKCIGCSLAVGPGGDIIAQGPYGEDAEALIELSVSIVEPQARGTALASMLRRKGYQGP